MKPKNIIKYAGVFVMIGLLLLPSITADITKRDIVRQSISLSELCSEDSVQLNLPGTYLSVPIGGQMPPQQRIVGSDTFEFNISSFFANDSGYAGCLESVNEILYSYPQLWIDPPVYPFLVSPNGSVILYGSRIYTDVFISDSRPIRQKAYLEIPTMDFKKPGKNWMSGPPLGGVVVWENGKVNRQWIGTYGVGTGTNIDTTIIYRSNLFHFKEVYRDSERVYFEYDYNVSSMGLWHMDVPPYSNNVPSQSVPVTSIQIEGATLNTVKGII